MAESFLKFTNTPVSAEAIAKAIKDRAEKEESERALLVAEDIAACQRVVNAGLKELNRLKKQLEEFKTEFKKFEDATGPVEFAAIVNASPIRHQTGTVTLRADYSAE